MIDRKNILLISTALLISAIVGLYIPYEQTKNRYVQKIVPLVESGEQVIVHYTKKGFEPGLITIKASSTVEWINSSDKPLWVASNPHPSHTDLPGFDEDGVWGNAPQGLQSIVPVAYAHTIGEAYRYTFIKVGRWCYHNHLVPNDRGVIIVLP